MNMQKVLGWGKANWLIIVSCVVLVAALVAGPVFGSRMTKDITTRVTKTVETDHSALARDTIPYTVPDPARPGESLVSENLPAHPTNTARFQELRERMKVETAGVWEEALEHNKNSHEVLIEGLFPKPSVADERVLPGEFAEVYILSAHQQLLDGMGARMPPDPAKVLTDLQTYYNSQVMRILDGREGNDLTAEEKAELTADLQKMRLGKYAQRASDATVYADVSVFNLPPLPTASPALTQCWDWQMRYWIHEDIVKAVAKANETSSGDRGVPGAVVKRLMSVLVQDRAGQSGQGSQGGRGRHDPHAYVDPYADPYASGDPYGAGDPYADPNATAGAAVVEETGPEIAPRDFKVSVTGRTSGAGSQNKHYDVRYVNVEAIVSSERLPLFLDAIAQTNFMTVVDLDLTSIDPAEHLSAGFYYGRDPVVRASMRIETLWFREWTKPLMPPVVRENRGIPAAEPAAAPRAPEPPAPAGGDDLDLGPG